MHGGAEPTRGGDWLGKSPPSGADARPCSRDLGSSNGYGRTRLWHGAHLCVADLDTTGTLVCPVHSRREPFNSWPRQTVAGSNRESCACDCDGWKEAAAARRRRQTRYLSGDPSGDAAAPEVPGKCL